MISLIFNEKGNVHIIYLGGGKGGKGSHVARNFLKGGGHKGWKLYWLINKGAGPEKLDKDKNWWIRLKNKISLWSRDILLFSFP